MSRILLCILLPTIASVCATAAIKVHPHWVNVNTRGATTVFLTFGGVAGFTAGESVWCGEVMDATPDIGMKPVPGTIFGMLPARLNLSRFSGTGGFTDIMSIPPSVTRRAYQAAAAGERSTFFYVRRFINTGGGPDEYVAVTCELGSGGARTPFALTGVELAYENQENLPSVHEGDAPPAASALISYTGTGQLQGRWEIVRPGDVPPSEQDLLTEATLPLEKRSTQRRYTELERFSIFLPPTGTFVLPGPHPTKLPTQVSGLYLLLLRIETSSDNEAVSNLAEAGAGPAAVSAGGVAGFPLPLLRYYVGGSPAPPTGSMTLLAPQNTSSVQENTPLTLSWTGGDKGALHRLTLLDPSNEILVSALIRPGTYLYHLQPWVWTKTQARHVSWKVEAVDSNGATVSQSEWRTLFRESASK